MGSVEIHKNEIFLLGFLISFLITLVPFQVYAGIGTLLMECPEDYSVLFQSVLYYLLSWILNM